MSTHTPNAPVTRVSTLELFFDLVFVFAITQVSHLFGHAHGAIDFVRGCPDHSAVISANVVGYAIPADNPPATRARKSTSSDGA